MSQVEAGSCPGLGGLSGARGFFGYLLSNVGLGGQLHYFLIMGPIILKIMIISIIKNCLMNCICFKS